MTGVQTCALPIFDFSIGTEFLSLEQRGDKVFVRARRSDTDEVETIEADYVVGADGARSKVRDAIGATMVGTRSRTGYYNFIIHAPGLHQEHGSEEHTSELQSLMSISYAVLYMKKKTHTS